MKPIAASEMELSNRSIVCVTGVLSHCGLRKANGKMGVVTGIRSLPGIADPRLTHLNPHLFRHSIARFLKSKRFSAEWIQNFLGHESYKTTMDMYGTLSIDEMQEVAERLLD